MLCYIIRDVRFEFNMLNLLRLKLKLSLSIKINYCDLFRKEFFIGDSISRKF